MSGSTLDDPLFERYVKLNCSVSPLEKEEDDYKMIVKYLDKTYDPVRIGDIVRIISLGLRKSCSFWISIYDEICVALI